MPPTRKRDASDPPSRDQSDSTERSSKRRRISGRALSLPPGELTGISPSIKLTMPRVTIPESANNSPEKPAPHSSLEGREDANSQDEQSDVDEEREIEVNIISQREGSVELLSSPSRGSNSGPATALKNRDAGRRRLFPSSRIGAGEIEHDAAGEAGSATNGPDRRDAEIVVSNERGRVESNEEQGNASDHETGMTEQKPQKTTDATTPRAKGTPPPDDGDGHNATIIRSSPKAVPVILHQEVTKKEYVINTIVGHRRSKHVEHAFELSVLWTNFDTPTWETERSIQAQVPGLVYKYWRGVPGGRPHEGVFRVFAVLKHWEGEPNKGKEGVRPRGRPRKVKEASDDRPGGSNRGHTYLVQWEGYSTNAGDTSVETEQKLRAIAPDELRVYWEHVGSGEQQQRSPL